MVVQYGGMLLEQIPEIAAQLVGISRLEFYLREFYAGDGEGFGGSHTLILKIIKLQFH